MRALEDDLFPSTPGKVKIERAGGTMNRQLHRCFASTSTMFLWALFLVAMTASYLSFQSFVDTSSKYFAASWGGLHWERQIRASAAPRRPPGSAAGAGMSVLVTGASGFVGAHCSLALRKRGDGVVGIDNFNAYYDPSLKKARKALLTSHGVFVVEGDINDQPASLYAATKKAGEEITHSYNHIYGLSITGLRFFTVYGPWGRPDMAYFSFTRNILQGKPITVYRGKNHVDLARDFTYIDDIVKGCLGSLDTAGRSTGTGGKKRGPAPYRIFNLGNTSPVTVPTLVAILEKHLRVKARKHVVEMPGNGDVPFTHANISLARQQLGYKPATNLDAGLKKFVKWYLSYYGYTRGSKNL
ncbi:unnamed protein product [Triticum turgidum subsp. durum]|uniref:NAD-dependent epimerase/dehydratase domain-containing protein n=1 Tax=Triticum turgidum subsp. durum TaxID=4567 RepID=A0A9R1B3X9_TRITD|nr:unnamed protein product [Triticum turgidum subsp. durum]